MPDKAFRREKQCAKCPWKKSTIPSRDIPNYVPEMHNKLGDTCRSDGFAPGAIMACHESKDPEQYACVGWLSHELGPGNNIPLRLAASSGKIGNVKTVGRQHETFEEFLEASKL